MTREKRIAQLGKLARHKTDMANAELRACEQRLAEQQGRLDQLVGYMEEYARNLSFAEGGAAGAFAIQNYRAFMAKIETAVAQQREQVRRIEEELQDLREKFREASTHSRSVEKLHGRVKAEAQQEQDQREQREMDAHATQRVMSRSGRAGGQ